MGRISALHILADLGLIYLLKSSVTLSVHLPDLTSRASMVEQLIEAERSVFVGQSAVTKYIGQMFGSQREHVIVHNFSIICISPECLRAVGVRVSELLQRQQNFHELCLEAA